MNPLLSLPVPVGTTFVSASDGGTLVGDSVQWNVGSLNPGDSGQRTMIVDVDNAAVDGQVLNANAVITDASISGQRKPRGCGQPGPDRCSSDAVP